MKDIVNNSTGAELNNEKDVYGPKAYIPTLIEGLRLQDK